MPTQLLENRFEIESQLSCTDFSTVYLGCDRRYTHRPTCLITAIPYHQREIRHRLEREAQLLERLGRHPQVPRVLAFFHDSNSQPDSTEPLGTFYLVQDRIEGHPISDEIKPGKKLSEGYVSKLIKEVLVALTFAHEQGLVHQNLHPQHLIREARNGQIFVTHFGKLAKIARSKVGADGTLGCSIPVGPSAYSAPEQLGAGSEKPQPASDLYALGLIAIEALTGQRHQDFAYDTHQGVRWRESVPVSLHLAEFIDRMIRQDWHDRFPHAKAALETFREESDRHQIANDSRMKTVVAAPGKKASSITASSTTQTGYTHLTTRLAAKRANPYLTKLAIGSVATILGLGIGVKAYQWGEYRVSLFPQVWQRLRSPNGSYPAAKASALAPLLEDGSILLQPAAATAFWQMVTAAKEDEIVLYPLSGYLAPDRLSDRLSKEEPSAVEILQGRSLQNDYATGYTLDIGGQAADLDRTLEFAQSPEFAWLRRNAKGYGFELSLPKDRQIGGPFEEPWHWRYTGDEASQKVFDP